MATAPAGGLLGFGGLALDHTGRPLVAYAYELKTQKTWLRLVHEDVKGRLVGERVTRLGFPSSEVLPAAAPVVLPSGAVRVVEAYDSATIEWARTKNHKDWIGQFVYATALGSPAGVVATAAGPQGVWSAWTELFPSISDTESELLLTLHDKGETTTILSHHAFLVALALSSTGPEVGGDDYVDLDGARTVFAGIVADAHGGSIELAGDLKGYDIDAAGGRQYLLVQPDGLDWYRAAVAPATHVALSASVQGAAFALSGTVFGPTGAPAAGTRPALAGDVGRRGAADHPPPRRRRELLDRRHAARAAAPLSRGVRRPGLGTSARLAAPDRSGRLRHLSTGCTECCGNVDYSLSANSGFFVFHALDPTWTTP